MRVSQRDILRFAEWSHDRNPLHVDPRVARGSFFGQCIAHGMLSALEALSVAGTPRGTSGTRVDIEFRGAVLPDVEYDVRATAGDGESTITVHGADAAALIVRVSGDETFPSAVTAAADGRAWIDELRARPDAQTLRTEPADRDVRALADGIDVGGHYVTADVPSDYLASGVVDPLLARALALCSYVIGMEAPGLRSLFTRATLQLAPPRGDADSATLLYRLRTARFDPHFRMLEVALDIADLTGAPLARADLRAYVRFSPVVTRPDVLLARLVPEAESLRGKVALVCGGTRGLGADLTAALAVAGCHVYASYHSDEAAKDDLAARLAPYSPVVEFLRGDAGDADWCRLTREALLARHGRLDLLVLNACAPPAALKVADATDRFSAYVERNVRLSHTPLAMMLPALGEAGGAIVAISSSFVDEMPAGFAHYVAVKQSLEATVRTAVREMPQVQGLLVRPPRLQTSWNDTPTGVPGTIPADWVATHVVNRLAAAWPAGRVEVMTEFPAPAEAPSAREDDQPPEFTIGVTASFTAEPLLPAFRLWFRELGIRGHVDVAPYGQVLQSLLDPGSVLSSGARGANVVFLRVRDWLRELPEQQAASAEYVRTYLETTARDLERAVRTHRGQAARETLLVFCPSEGEAAPEIEQALSAAESSLATSLAGVPGLTVIDARDWHAIYAVATEGIHDHVRDHLAHVPYQAPYFHVLSTIAMRHLHRRIAPLRKVVVVDCDNTLWRGVVGEVGAEGLEFDAGHSALHATLDRLSRSGIVVCLCSKNEEADVWRVFETRPDLLLARDRVVAAMINWQPKSQNLRTLAARLNLGLDSFVFVDDNPVECAEVQANCPEVLTLQWPQDPDRAIALLRHTWELDVTGATAEDAKRTRMYQEEFKRQELLEGTLTFGDFIKSLGLVVEIATLTPGDLKRASQLTQRTNQFNFTTRRRDEAAMQALVDAGTHEIRTVRVRDRFGDYGLVGLLIAEPQADRLDVDSFMVSCRVLGRGVEHEMAAELGRLAVARQLPTVRMVVETTKRNTPARAFLDALAPEEYKRTDPQRLECEVPAAWLADFRFEPTQAAPQAVAEDGGKAAPQALDADTLRRRERRIARTAFELATPAALTHAIEGRPLAAASPAAGRDDVETIVVSAFASALKLPAEQVRAVDRLEALGCDSFKIVEITVSLLETFPTLPTTLLFEHPSVAEIVEEIQGLSGPRSARGAVTGAAPAVPTRDERAAGPATLDIAVVGLHARTAGADSPDDLWRLLSTGSVAVRPVTDDRKYFLGRLRDSRPHWAGLLDDVDRFDAELFGISPREAVYMDPQLRLFLEVAWAALEDAGCFGPDVDEDTGVFVGVMYADYVHAANGNSRGATSPYRSWEGFSLANRLSQVLGLRGPSVAVETACSSSGTALHLACRALAAGDCRSAIVGGVNLILDPDRFAQLGRLGILSAAGRCLAFGADADGTVLGEGAGAVVLRRLTDAVARGDRIYGVITGTGVSTGSGTVGFTAPNPQAQAEAIRRAVQAAGIDPRTIGYVETHGTGTSLGDPIEVRGLTLAHGDRALRDARLSGDGGRCRIGSIKPNIGHLEAGAAVLGLVKILLQLRHGHLVPSVSSEATNPQIPFDQVPFELQRRLEPWPRRVFTIAGQQTPVPRRAGLSTFGVGGANAHLVIEEPPDLPALEATQSRVERPAHVLALSARNDDALARRASDMAAWFELHPDVSLADACHSANTGRRPFEKRLALVATSCEQAVDALRRAAAGDEPPGVVRGSVSRSGPAPKVAFLYTGQGSQYAGMGQALYEHQPVFRAALDRCAAVFDPLLGTPLLSLLFAPPGSPQAALLDQTGCTQPALFAFQHALGELWRSWGVTPAAVIGHSVGEFAAACLAGAMSLEDALRLVAARGRLMQALPAGGRMTSVAATEERVTEAIRGYEDRVALAGINAPRQVVVSGEGAAVAEIEATLAAAGIRTKALVVSHAFHSPLMRPMIAEFAKAVADVRFATPAIPLVSGVHGTLTTTDLAQPDYWVRQVLEPVRFASGMATLAAQGIDTYVEIGPHPVLLGLGRQCVADAENAAWLPSQRREADAWQTLLASVAQLWVRGGAVDWRAFDAPYLRQRVSVPAYPFGGRRYWIEVDSRARDATGESRATAEVTAEAAASVRRGPRLYEVVWRESAGASAAAPAGAGAAATGRWLVLGHETGLGPSLCAELARRGGEAILVVPGESFARRDEGRYVVAPSSRADFELLADAVSAGAPLRGVVHAWAAADEPLEQRGLAAGKALGLASLVHLLQVQSGPGRAAGNDTPRMWVVTRQGVQAAQGDAVSPLAAAAWGLGRTIALEHPEAWGGLVDLPAAGEDGAGASAGLLAGHLLDTGDEDQVAWRAGKRLVARLVEAGQVVGQPLALTADATYLVTGGLGALGLRAARWLADKGARHLVLVSRRGVRTDEQRRAVESLSALGVSVTVESADLARRDEVARVVAAIAAGPSPLRGIVHAAGLDAIVALREMDAADLDTIVTAKADAAWALHELTRGHRLDFFIGYSSIASVLGSFGRGHYAAANAFLDGLAAHRRAAGLPALSLSWGPWKDGGMATEASLREFERIGNHGLVPDEAMRLLDVAASSGRTQLAVADIDWETFAPVYESRRRRPVLTEVQPAGAREAPAVVAAAALAPWAAQLAAVDPGARASALEELVRAEVARALGFGGPHEVPPDRSFYDLGMDSLVAAELAGRLKRQVGFNCTGLLFDHPTVAGLTPELLARLTLPGTLAAASGPQTAMAGVAATAVETPGPAATAWLQALHEAPPERRTDVLTSMIRDEAARTLGFERGDQVPADASLLDLGMDSLSAAELGSRLQKQLGARATGLIFQHPEPARLAARLLQEMSLGPAAESAGVAVAASASPAGTAGEVTGRPTTAVATVPPTGVVRYSEEAAREAIAFQREAWPRRRADLIEPRWRWMFEASARRLGVEPQVWLFRNQGRIVAHNGAIAVDVSIDGERVPTAWLVDTMVLESHRSQALGARLMVHAHEDLPFALSLGQTETMRTIQLRMGWHQVAPLQTAQLLVRPERVLKGKLPGPAAVAAVLGLRVSSAIRGLWRERVTVEVRQVDRFGQEHDRLWETMARTLPCAVVRDASYLNWKYVDQPGQSFLRFEARRAGVLVGVAVWVLRPADRAYHYDRAHLVDLVCPLDDGDAVAQVLRGTGEAAAEHGADALVCFHVGQRLTTALQHVGFLMRDPRRFLLVDPGPLEGVHRQRVLAGASWFLTQGDSDIDRPW